MLTEKTFQGNNAPMIVPILNRSSEFDSFMLKWVLMGEICKHYSNFADILQRLENNMFSQIIQNFTENLDGLCNFNPPYAMSYQSRTETDI